MDLTPSERLLIWMRRNRVRQQELARRVGRSQSRIAKYLNGLDKPDLEAAAAIERETAGLVRAAEWVNGAAQVANG